MRGLDGHPVTELRRLTAADVRHSAAAAGPRRDRTRREAWPASYRRRLVIGDLAGALVACGTASYLRFGSVLLLEFAVVTVLVTIGWVTCLAVLHGYDHRVLGNGTQEYATVTKSGVLLLGLIGLTSYASMAQLARLWVLAAILSLVCVGLVWRRILRQWLSRCRRQGRMVQRVVVVGSVESAAELVGELMLGPEDGFRVVGICAPFTPESNGRVAGLPLLARPDDVLLAVDYVDADVVAVSGHPEMSGRALRNLAWALEERGVDLVVSPGIFQVAGPRLSIRPAAGVSLLHVERPAHGISRVFVKSVIDWVAALFLTIAAGPLMLGIALAVKLGSAGPVLFRQTRVGEHGETFKIFKFRTMVVGAESRRDEAAGHAVNSVLFKQADDPRITGVGRVLRRTSLDELPQLINVLLGQMSLVGPRPGLPEEVSRYASDALRRLRVRPGMTGLWQVSGRSSLTWEQTVRLDLWYVDNWTPMLDLQILVRTARSVLTADGAC